jgi:hypothetical protein
MFNSRFILCNSTDVFIIIGIILLFLSLILNSINLYFLGNYYDIKVENKGEDSIDIEKFHSRYLNAEEQNNKMNKKSFILSMFSIFMVVSGLVSILIKLWF